MDQQIKAVVLGAGKGKRLQTEGCDLPKVMRLACGRPLMEYVLDGLSFIPRDNIVLVVGYKRESVQEHFRGYPFAVQEEQLGTGHAVMSAEPAMADYQGAVLVCCGDMPLLTRATYLTLVDAHFSQGNDCTILSSESSENLPFGRIVRDRDGDFLKIVEDKDCTPDEKSIRELNTGVYVFNAGKLFPALKKLRNNNAQGEYYLTDVPDIFSAEGAKVGICRLDLGRDIVGVNTPLQLQEVEDILRRRVI